MYIEKLGSAIKNDKLSGLRGYHSNLSINLQQLQDDVVECRLEMIKTISNKGVSILNDLLLSINCIEIDCKSLERCPCKTSDSDTLVAHFEIPQIISDFGKNSIQYIGSTDRKNNFKIITSISELNYRSYRKRKMNTPYVWIDLSPNSNGMLDCYLFNTPLLKEISVTAAFKDPRQLKKYKCCNDEQELLGSDTNISFIDQLVKEKLTEKKIKYYRQLKAPNIPNTQSYE